MYFCLSLLFEIISPTIAMALTSGPAQEEFASFEPAATTDMVDLYTGDYNYNIPLLSIPGPNGGYPINLAYHSGVGMDQEASWVGLGWNINVGAISRNLRGLPDDFNGDGIKKVQHIKKNTTTSFDVGSNSGYNEIVGFPMGSGGGGGGSGSLQVYHNSYKGIGMRYTYGVNTGGSPFGLDISTDSQSGVGIGLSFSAGTQIGEGQAGVSAGLDFNSRQGLQSFNFGASYKMNDGGAGKSSSISFATVFGVPKATLPMSSTSVPFHLRLGSANPLFQFSTQLGVSGSVFVSKVVNNGKETIPGQGYLNTSAQTSVLRDFVRNEIMYTKKIPHLPTSSFTYDLFQQTGQGTGSVFRPHLNTFGVLTTPARNNEDKIIGLGLELGIGASFDLHVGVDFDAGDGGNTSGPWNRIKDDADWGSNLNSAMNWYNSNTNRDYERSYFKVLGEKTGKHLDDDQLASFGGDGARRIKITTDKRDVNWLNRHYVASDDLVRTEGGSPTTLDASKLTDQKSTQRRKRRATSIESLNGSQSAQYGFSKGLKYYDRVAEIEKNKDLKPGHHMSEISMLQTDGMRYVYGLPVYNNKQVDNVFAVAQSYDANPNPLQAFVNPPGSSGTSAGGISLGGTYDEFVSKNELPAYAHSWLLTSVLSSDYLDVTSNGPTEDDFGYWVKFNYEKVHGTYRWRAPYAEANYIDGYKTNPNDNKGSYLYGEKEIYVLKSIETKTHTAVFYTSSRKDTWQPASELNGGVTGGSDEEGNTLRKLDNVKLYTKKELAGLDPVATKIVNFEYSYDLCPNVPNNKGVDEIVSVSDGEGGRIDIDLNEKSGKLTLKKLYFTYQTSDRGRFSPYVFNYGDVDNTDNNPVYNPQAMDRWGTYRKTSIYGSMYPFVDHPFTDQDPNYVANQPVAPWTLREISLPTGGTLKMEYEPDDYAYVENKQAMRMFDIATVGEPNDVIAGSARSATSFSWDDVEAGDGKVYFKLEEPITTTMTKLGISGVDYTGWFKKLYLDNLPGGFVSFNVLAKIRDDYYDYVKGYAEIDWTAGSYGIHPTNADYGFITLKKKPLASPVNTLGIEVSPFTRATLEHLRTYRQELMYDPFAYPDGGVLESITNLLGAFISSPEQLLAATVGWNNYAYTKQNWCHEIRPYGYSTIRLCVPDYQKIGGGIRVKKITLDDNWRNNPSVSENSSYGQKYTYTKDVMISGEMATVSSGVAYEPKVGADESALRTPIPYERSVPLSGVYNMFLENPIMEDYYPAAMVGYSKVKVESIAPDEAFADNPSNPLDKSAAPISIYEFYTPKDFPIQFDKTDMNVGQPMRMPIFIPGILTSMKTRQAKSQGYSVILNDMAGKPKAMTTMTKEGQQVITRQRFIYNTENPYNESAINKLSSKVQTLETDASNDVQYITSIVGQSHDMFFDMNEDEQQMETFGMEINFDLHYTAPAGIAFMVMPIPSATVDESNLRTIVFNKVITRTGILKKVEATKDGSTITTENLAFDIDTGEPILTKVTNEFKDPIYNFNYPGHWYYSNMKGAHKNFGFEINPTGSSTFSSDSDGYIELGSLCTLGTLIPSGTKVSDFFAKGDLLQVDCGGALSGKYHILNMKESGSNNSIQLINTLGHLFPASTSLLSLKVIKSGFKNMQDTKVGGMAFKELNTTFEDYVPSDDAGTRKDALTDVFYADLADDKIINASAVEFYNDWQVFCGTAGENIEECNCTLNPEFFDFVSLLQSLQADGLLLSTYVPLGNFVTGSYLHGMTELLVSSSPKLLAAQTAAIASGPVYDDGLYYTGLISGGDFYFTIFNDATAEITVDGNKVLCQVKFDFPHGVSPSSVTFTGYELDPGESCEPTVSFTGVVDGGGPISIPLTVSSPCSESCPDCWSFAQCTEDVFPNLGCGIQEGQPINPYWAGMKGMWRPRSSYAYHTARTQTDNIKDDGVFTDFVRFPWEAPLTKDDKWITAKTVTKYSPYGFELENKDALGNYSSALYGYNQTLLTAVGSNAKYTEIAFDNFEDYPLGCTDKHFRFNDYIADIVNTQAHTGKHSISVDEETTLTVNVGIEPGEECAFVPIDDVTDPTTTYEIEGSSDLAAHLVNCGDCLGEFTPAKSKKYVASVWVKEVGDPGLTNYTAPQFTISVTKASGPPVIHTLTPSGNVIDGWQRIFGTFDVASNAIGISVNLINTSSSAIVYFDDIRLHPFDGNMISYVYDPLKLRAVAELDANNFATFYIYNDEGHVVKVKKETAEGIKTIKESRTNNKILNE